MSLELLQNMKIKSLCEIVEEFLLTLSERGAKIKSKIDAVKNTAFSTLKEKEELEEWLAHLNFILEQNKAAEVTIRTKRLI